MALSFVAAGAVSTGANPTVALPAGYAAADLLFLVTCGSATPTTPTGWTRLSAEGAGQFITVFWKYATGSESSVALTQTGTTTKAVMLAYRGGGAFQVLPAYTTGTSTTATPNTLTTTYSNDFVISIYAGANIAQTWTANGSTTSRVNSAGTTSVRSLLIADETQAAAGTSTARAATLDTSNTWASVAIALIPTRTVYWVGGTGTWNTSSTTNWADSSNGSGGVVAPSPWDNAVIDTNSGTGTITASGNCLDLTVTATQAITLTVQNSLNVTIYVYGSLTLPNSGSFTIGNNSRPITFASTTTGKTVSTNAITVRNLAFDGIGGGWTLGSALTSDRSLIITNGSFSTGNYNITASFSSNNSNVRSISFGSSTISGSIDFTTTTNLTFDAGTSQLNVTGNLLSGGLTFYNVSLQNRYVLTNVTGSNTFNNLEVKQTYAGGAGGYTYLVKLFANQTINGTLSTNQNIFSGPVFRFFFCSDTLGTARTITVANNAANYCDFRDITIAGAASPISGTSYSNCGGNTNITFTAAKTVYWNASGSQYFSDGWATSSGGTPSGNNIPLAQDTAIIDNTGAAGTIDCGSHNVGVINITRTSAVTLNILAGSFGGQNIPFTLYGNLTLGTNTTVTASGGYQYIQFSGVSTQTITSNSVVSGAGLNIYTPSSNTVKLGDNFTASLAKAGAVTLTNGTIDLNGKTLTLSASATATFLTATGTKNLTFNGGTLSIAASGTTAFNNAVPTGFTTTAGTGIGTITLTSASSKTFVGNGSTFNCSLDQGGAGTLTVTGVNTFNDITNTYGATGATTITLPASTTTTVNNFTASGTVGKLLTLQSSTAGTRATLSKASGTVSVSYVSIKDSNATGGALWQAYSINGNVDNGNNTGWDFGMVSGNGLLFGSNF